MSRLAYTVHVAREEYGNTVAFGPDSDEIPDWAIEKIGAHAFEDGIKPELKESKSEKGDGDKGDGKGADVDPLEAYLAKTRKELEAEVAERNSGREEDALVVVEEPGNKPELAAALVADDKKVADQA